MLLYVLALSDFINFALKRDSPRATSPHPEWTTNCSFLTFILQCARLAVSLYTKS